MPLYRYKPSASRSLRRPVTRYSGSGAYRKTTYKPKSRTTRVRGSGAYTFDNPGPWGKAGQVAGTLIGSRFGHPNFGGYAGRYLGHRVGKLFGSGSYEYVPADSTVMAPDVPKFSNTKDDSVVICHREYLGDVLSASTANTFKIESFPLNPASSNTFPWLSNIAGPNYQQYRFEGLIFEFRSFSADALNSTNTALGSVSACINYDYSDADPQSRYDIENTDWSKACKPSEDMVIPVECKQSQTGMNGLLYVLNSPVIPPNTDPKTYFLGKLWIATQGFQGTNVNIGSLYVTYKVRLYKPLMSRPLSQAMIAIGRRLNPTIAQPFGDSTETLDVSCDSIGISIAPNVFTIRKERLIVGQVYCLTLYWRGSATSNLSRPNFTLSSNISNYEICLGGSQNWEDSPNPGTNTGAVRFLLNLFFKVTNNSIDATLTGTGTGLIPTGASQVEWRVMQICGVSPSDTGSV